MSSYSTMPHHILLCAFLTIFVHTLSTMLHFCVLLLLLCRLLLMSHGVYKNYYTIIVEYRIQHVAKSIRFHFARGKSHNCAIAQPI